MTEDKSLVPQPSGTELIETYPLLRPQGAEQILALINENLGAQRFSILNLPRIKVGTGGSLNFRMDTVDGEASPRELEGILIAWRAARIYWKRAFGRSGGKKPPDCTSNNGFIGIGDPGGNCEACPNAQFGTAINADGSQGGGQACKDIRQLLIVLPDEILPHLMNIPPTSVKPFTQYTLNLLSGRRSFWGVTTKFTLERSTSEGNIDYARVAFRPGRHLKPEEQQALYPYHQRMKEILTPSTVEGTWETAEAGARSDDDETPF